MWWSNVDEDGMPVREVKPKVSSQEVNRLIQETVSKSLNVSMPPDEDGYITYPWKDPKTGYTYQIREKVPNGPQGDFRVSKTESNAKFKSLMGESRTQEQQAPAGSRDVLRPDITIEDAEILQQMKLERTLKSKQHQAAKRESLFGVHRDTVESEEEWIPDLPANRTGLNETKRNIQEVPQASMRGKKGQDQSVKPQTAQTFEDLGNQGRSKVFDPVQIEDTLLSRDTLQKAQNVAFRGLFGEHMALDLVERKGLRKDAKVELDSSAALLHAVIELGYLGPKKSSEISEGPLKEDTIAFHLGSRALDGLLHKGKISNEFQELPLSQRDMIRLALGRTIVQVTEDFLGGRLTAELLEESIRNDVLVLETWSRNIKPDMAAMKISSDIVISDRAQRHNPLTNAVANAFAQEAQARGLTPEMYEAAKKEELQFKQTLKLMLENGAQKSGTELQEGTLRTETILDAMLRMPTLSAELLQSILKPEKLESRVKPESVIVTRRSAPEALGQKADHSLIALPTTNRVQKEEVQVKPTVARYELSQGQSRLVQPREGEFSTQPKGPKIEFLDSDDEEVYTQWNLSKKKRSYFE